jgi:hypothetical protein
MSGLNRQARQEDVMNDAKNRLVACYLGTVDHLQPGYLLIEQVRHTAVQQQQQQQWLFCIFGPHHRQQTRS